MIIAIVGIDGSGKSTLAKDIASDLNAQGVSARYFENAGGRPVIAKLAVRLGRADGVDLLGRTGFLMVEALVRWVMITRAVVQTRLTGRVAVMDRYSYCQYAAIRTRKQRGERLARLMFGRFPRPDLVCFLKLDPALAQRRVELRGTDNEELSYLIAADRAYRSLPEFSGFSVVDASISRDGVRATVINHVYEAMRAKS